jgi:putative FmdB family regulatory protein|tara:strand:+ start:283 stop:600 length:318 start_codon:yes stop_codon:yes gene_type:complete
MPLYEYRCGDCGRVSTVLTFSWSNAGAIVCQKCGRSNMSRLVSRFAFHRSWGDSLNWVPGEEMLGDTDEDDPQRLDQFMGQVKDEMGGQVSPDFESLRRDTSAGS